MHGCDCATNHPLLRRYVIPVHLKPPSRSWRYSVTGKECFNRISSVLSQCPTTICNQPACFKQKNCLATRSRFLWRSFVMAYHHVSVVNRYVMETWNARSDSSRHNQQRPDPHEWRSSGWGESRKRISGNQPTHVASAEDKARPAAHSHWGALPLPRV